MLSSRRGFSLVEIVIVLSIITIGTMVSIPPLLMWKKNAEIRGATSQLVSSLRLARNYALKHSDYVVTEFHGDGYEIYVDNGEGGGVFGDWVRSGEEKLLCRYKPSSGLLFSSNFHFNRFRFKGFGRNQPGTISLSNRGNSTVKIVVNVVGRIRSEYN